MFGPVVGVEVEKPLLRSTNPRPTTEMRPKAPGVSFEPTGPPPPRGTQKTADVSVTTLMGIAGTLAMKRDMVMNKLEWGRTVTYTADSLQNTDITIKELRDLCNKNKLSPRGTVRRRPRAQNSRSSGSTGALMHGPGVSVRSCVRGWPTCCCPSGREPTLTGSPSRSRRAGRSRAGCAAQHARLGLPTSNHTR
jgi:hypothetical protein